MLEDCTGGTVKAYVASQAPNPAGLLNIAIDVAAGCEYLAHIHIVIREICSETCFVKQTRQASKEQRVR